ncbi:uncharacterized protein J4E88_002536 [Alternaria novae-zelandiae]|uniref:uncharacterized protein n=1 Tax=Alternaria novae-zelandiae TaxID=430562 RepID=UPI0020C2B5A5|nr:uncharacterized protein J4E88_002536 [Alternaria novae-zelandiae]KAI4689187.1 hypothetical protein J4E88_002536 [Alternaria novae-zelandiae]
MAPFNMASLPTTLVARKQKKIVNAAFAAIEAHDAHAQTVPEQAKLSVNDVAVIANNPYRFYFDLWSGLPYPWLVECFGVELAKRLVGLNKIALEVRAAVASQPDLDAHKELVMEPQRERFAWNIPGARRLAVAAEALAKKRERQERERLDKLSKQ